MRGWQGNLCQRFSMHSCPVSINKSSRGRAQAPPPCYPSMDWHRVSQRLTGGSAGGGSRLHMSYTMNVEATVLAPWQATSGSTALISWSTACVLKQHSDFSMVQSTVNKPWWAQTSSKQVQPSPPGINVSEGNTCSMAKGARARTHDLVQNYVQEKSCLYSTFPSAPNPGLGLQHSVLGAEWWPYQDLQQPILQCRSPWSQVHPASQEVELAQPWAPYRAL